jgi:hypothetical protein
MPIPPRQPGRSVNPEIERLLYQVKVIRQEADGLVAGLDGAHFNWRPADGGWSIAQCFDHLNLTNRRFLDILKASVEQARREGKLDDGPYTYSFLSRWMFRAISPPVKRKFRAARRFQPADEKAPDVVMTEWARTHDEFVEVLQRASGLDLARIKVPSPVTRLLRYDLGMAFWILTAHDRRHLAQVRNIRNSAGFPPVPLPGTVPVQTA